MRIILWELFHIFYRQMMEIIDLGLQASCNSNVDHLGQVSV
jgi:hypothetical protein